MPETSTRAASSRQKRFCPDCDAEVTRIHRNLWDKLTLRTSVYWCKACKSKVVPLNTALEQKARWKRREGTILLIIGMACAAGWFVFLLLRPPDLNKKPVRPRAPAAASGAAHHR